MGVLIISEEFLIFLSLLTLFIVLVFYLRVIFLNYFYNFSKNLYILLYYCLDINISLNKFFINLLRIFYLRVVFLNNLDIFLTKYYVLSLNSKILSIRKNFLNLLFSNNFLNNFFIFLNYNNSKFNYYIYTDEFVDLFINILSIDMNKKKSFF